MYLENSQELFNPPTIIVDIMLSFPDHVFFEDNLNFDG